MAEQTDSWRKQGSRLPIVIVGLLIIGAAALGSVYLFGQSTPAAQQSEDNTMPQPADDVQESGVQDTGTDKVVKSDAEWQAELTQEQYYVTRKHGTERAFTGEYWDNKQDGVYHCVGCGAPLFDSETKYESRTGWPSFWQPIGDEGVGTQEDNRLFSRRAEVHCDRCDAHLGHVFPDGPAPTHQRYCINSASLDFRPRGEANPSDEESGN